MKDNSEIFPTLKVGNRVKRNFAFDGKPPLCGTVIGFKDVVDVDFMDDGASEEEATIPGGAFVVRLDKDCRPRHRHDDGTVTEIEEWDVDAEASEDWDVI